MILTLGDRPYRRAQTHRVSQVLGDPLRDGSRATFDHVLLRATLDREQRVDASVRTHEEQQVEERHLVQITCEQAAHRHLEQIARDGGPDPGALEPPSHRARIPLIGAPRHPWGVNGDVLRHPIELHLRQRDRDDREWTDLGNEAPVTARSSLADEEVSALHPCLVRGRPHLPREPEDRIVPGAQPRASAVDRRAIGEMLRPDPAPDAVTRLEHDDGPRALEKSPSGRKSGVSGTDDADVRIDPLGHRGRTVLDSRSSRAFPHESSTFVDVPLLSAVA